MQKPFANIRTEERQAFGCLLKLPESLVDERNATGNQVNAFLFEFDIQH